MACNILEVCGRFMYKTQNTHERTKNILATMIRLKNAKNLDNRLDTMLENAYYMCRPPEQSAKSKKKERPAVQEYIRHLFFSRLTKQSLDEVVKQLRKVAWKENEAYIVKCVLKVQKSKYNQVYLFASLVSSLTKYHPSLAISVADDLLNEIRYLLHLNEFSKQQRLLGLVKLLGELYNDLVVDSQVVFDALYILLSAGNERVGPMPDPPTDFFRVRVICLLLDTCGHYFDRGSAKKRLDLFLAHFQRYLLSKIPPPKDVGFTISDTFEALGAAGDRVQTIQGADERIAKLEGDFKFSRVRGLAALEVLLAGKDQDQEDMDDSEESEESDGEKVDSEDEGGNKEDADKADDDEFDDEFDYQVEEQEEKVVVHWKPKAPERTPEDEAFDAMFSQMMMGDSKPAGPKRLDLSVPMNLKEDTNEPKVVNDAGEAKVVFQLLTKKGNKTAAKDLAIPLESDIASTSLSRGNAEADEKAELKRKVLGYQAEADGVPGFGSRRGFVVRGGYRGR
eukprot:CAMPEP_0184325304 /NCGR_PEP_ID=MMETSP1049-20130417/139744_1 /TAXON_ID=77928 /ORGANISM="Proteomonas sulcata, Strain CCMP704" /LENGTH=507 /DNA_ID=CAMNT_0026647327 /DNA_START=12 /DNA_END=1535 /DNA_ORIENTATION=+